MPPAGSPRRKETLSNLRALCPRSARPCLLAARRGTPNLQGSGRGLSPHGQRAATARCPPLPCRERHSGNKAREVSARPGCLVLPARCRAPGWNGSEVGAVWGQGARQCRSEWGSAAVRGGWPLGEPGTRLLFLAMTVQIHVALRLGRWEEGGGRGASGEDTEGKGRVELSAGIDFSHLSLTTMRESVLGESGSAGSSPSRSPSTLQGPGRSARGWDCAGFQGHGR